MLLIAVNKFRIIKIVLVKRRQAKIERAKTKTERRRMEVKKNLI